MHVMIDLYVIQWGLRISVSEYIAKCEKILNQAGLETNLIPMAQMSQEIGTTFLALNDGAMSESMTSGTPNSHDH